MRIFDPPALILSAMAASSASFWLGPVALAQSQPEPIAVVASPLPSPASPNPCRRCPSAGWLPKRR